MSELLIKLTETAGKHIKYKMLKNKQTVAFIKTLRKQPKTFKHRALIENISQTDLFFGNICLLADCA